MRRLFAVMILAASLGGAAAQQAADPKQLPPDPRCPPEARRNVPHADPNTPLSEDLAQSKGVICPPAVDSGITKAPPEGGAMRVIPPPGSPGGNRDVQPK
jgi:hypothetical protein